MTIATLLAGLLVMIGTAPGPPQPDSMLRFNLQVGSTVLIGIETQERPRIEGGRAAPMSPEEIDLIRKMVADHPDAFGPKAALVHSDEPVTPIKPRHIRFSFIPFEGGKQSLLVIENGFGRALAYKAVTGHGTKRAPTDVCAVPPNYRGLEHWSYPLDWIEIADIHPIDWKDGDPIRCE